jgi:hypothetical protein
MKVWKVVFRKPLSEKQTQPKGKHFPETKLNFSLTGKYFLLTGKYFSLIEKYFLLIIFYNNKQI